MKLLFKHVEKKLLINIYGLDNGYNRERPRFSTNRVKLSIFKFISFHGF